ncbi:glycosyltransferase family 4 protein [Halobacteriaceae archaeon GCM10025711]
MRVAFVSAVTSHHRDTPQAERVRRTAELLAARGHEVVVFCGRWWDGSLDEFEHDDVTYRAVTPDATGWRFLTRLPGRLREFDPDVVHAVHHPPGHVVAAWVGGVLASAPVVVDWYDTKPREEPGGAVRRHLRRKARRLATRLPATIVTPSATVKTGVRELGAADEDVRVVPNPVEMDRIREATVNGTADVVFSRHLDEDANLESLLLSLAEFRDREWTTVVVGDGPERESYERQARDLRIQDQVEFVGDQDLDDLLPVLRGAHVYVHTATRTSFATDLLRGLASGCVGIVQYHAESSAHELVERRERGFLVTDETELKQALVEAGEMERRDLDEAFAEFDEREYLERVLDCYRDAMGETA